MGVLRLSGWTGYQSDSAVAGQLAAQGSSEDQYEASIHASKDDLAGAMGEFANRLAGASGTSYRLLRKRLSSAGILRARAAGIYDCAWSCGKRKASSENFGGCGC